MRENLTPPPSQLEFNLFPPEQERQQQLEGCKKILQDIIKSDEKFEFKKAQIIQLALKYPQGENACREIYKEMVGVSFRGFADGHGYDELVQGILNPEQETDRLRDVDAEERDPTDKGVWRS